MSSCHKPHRSQQFTPYVHHLPSSGEQTFSSPIQVTHTHTHAGRKGVVGRHGRRCVLRATGQHVTANITQIPISHTERSGCSFIASQALTGLHPDEESSWGFAKRIRTPSALCWHSGTYDTRRTLQAATESFLGRLDPLRRTLEDLQGAELPPLFPELFTDILVVALLQTPPDFVR
eukprot:3924178-Rhodomonas_salina.1